MRYIFINCIILLPLATEPVKRFFLQKTDLKGLYNKNYYQTAPMEPQAIDQKAAVLDGILHREFS